MELLLDFGMRWGKSLNIYLLVETSPKLMIFYILKNLKEFLDSQSI